MIIVKTLKTWILFLPFSPPPPPPPQSSLTLYMYDVVVYQFDYQTCLPVCCKTHFFYVAIVYVILQ